ncbi:2OG-Fe(II) oxygenase [Cyanobacteria bacterium FACHB-63]|nr:2OG-Fe(II) oxygenase [Cyanobacteria bacterium FACHB-63]
MKLYLDANALQKIALENRQQYSSALPFPHIVLDNVLPEEALNGVLNEFPSIDNPIWKQYKTSFEAKLESQGEDKLGVFTNLLLYQFNSPPFLKFLETLTGIDNLIPDPYFFGGGLHQIPKGGKLGIHADYSKHGKLKLERRLNVLLYLNKDWQEEYGGHLELWNSSMSECVRRILPIYNRMVVFTITDWAFHGHPEPLTCPDGWTRKSIALYYFTASRPEGEVMDGGERYGALFLKRPGETVLGASKKSTDYRVKDGRVVARKDTKWWIKRFTPPIALDVWKSLRNK